MDQEDLPSHELAHALMGLGRLNSVGLAALQIWQVLKRLITQRSLKRISILDLASGGGDILFALERFAKAAGIEFEGLGLDINEQCVLIANRRSEQVGSTVQFQKVNVHADPIPDRYDIVLSSLFLHHLQTAQAATVLRKMSSAAKVALVVSDLTRSRLALLTTILVARVITRSSVVHTDAPLSIRAAFTIEEAYELADTAGLKNPRIRPIPGFRFLLIEEK